MALPQRTSTVTVDPALAAVTAHTEAHFAAQMRNNHGEAWTELQFSAEPEEDLQRSPDPDEATGAAHTPSWWVVHLVIEASNVQGALAMADAVARVAGAHHPPVVAGETSVSRVDHQSARHQVYCDRRLTTGEPGRRCELLHGHLDGCGPRVNQ
jgi:hypothetical protein